MNSLKILFTIFYGLLTLVFGHKVKQNGMELEYKIAFSQCSVYGKVIGQFVGVSLNECVYQCFIRSECSEAAYRRHATLCELRNHGNEEVKREKIAGCVSVVRSDIINLKQSDADDQSSTTAEESSPRECEPFELDNGRVFGNMYNIGSKREVVCDAGFSEADDIYQVTCLTNGSWSHIPVCVMDEPTDKTTTDNPTDPPTNPPTNAPTNPPSNPPTNPPATVKPGECGEPKEKENAHVLPGTTHEGSQRKYECNAGFNVSYLHNKMTTTCNNDGRWSETDFLCVIDCGPIPDIPNSHSNQPYLTVLGYTSTYRCNDGYEFVSDIHLNQYSVTVKCLENRTWSNIDNWSCEKKKTIGTSCYGISNVCTETGAVCWNNTCFCDPLSRYNDTLRDCIKVCDNLTEDFQQYSRDQGFWKFSKEEYNIDSREYCETLCRTKDCLSYYYSPDYNRCYYWAVTYGMMKVALGTSELEDTSLKIYSKTCA